MIGTVKGDVHDIGKNLVDSILTNNGYEVTNLGIKVPIAEFIERATEIGADAIGMSGLLVKSTLIMRENLEDLNARGLSHIPVILGGGAAPATTSSGTCGRYMRDGCSRQRPCRLADDTRMAERMRFAFPRQQKDRHLCIADFFRSVESGEADYAAFHVVTMGQVASEHSARLFDANRYQEYLFAHGLSVEMAEALAEHWHRRIREEWGFADEDGPSLAGLFRQKYRGSRYSWGYPACPDLEDQVKVGELLQVGRIGVTVSEEYQLHPEQSTSAIVVHHPEAKPTSATRPGRPGGTGTTTARSSSRP